ncbi:putative ATPase [Actinomycetospora succinea]|uniref:Putative ATPase n=1 Tax=Actinomycetospora succinea TaxID=663603 RepID=A0A4R6VQX1_9PSEU|nr:BTAD domain-containing putative transcriptional regulator [Actinomycetospora succinea]TDQ64924.1 putative ATPase [Actinomycetospora succinea]
MLAVALLGPVEVRRDGELLALPAGRTTEVLVRLALEAGRTVRAERVLADLWPGAASQNTLQSKVSQLRRALGDADLVPYAHGAYRLAVDPARIDALDAEARAERVAAARRAGDIDTVRREAAAALALFRGEVLQDAGDGAWLDAPRRRWEELRLALLEDHLAARVALGDGDVVGELEDLVARHPLREGLWSALITALYRAGRQADALAAYARVRTLLADELGLDPGPGLRRLEEGILRQSPALTGAQPGNLPAVLTRLVGRDDELAALDARLREHRLVTVTGPAGVGKTRTALEVARDLEAPDGVWLVRLDGVATPESVPRAVAEALHVAAGDLAGRFAGSAAVLLLDNAEHVVEAVAALVETLLAAAPRLRVLVTSQVSLGVDGEVVVPLGPLPEDAAVALFADRAARLSVTVDPAQRDAVAGVCRRLDGLPLAIELAASRLTTLSVPEVARRLDDRFRLLRDPTRRSPARRRELAAAIAWSHDLLPPGDRRALWALAVFAEGAPLAAAEHVLTVVGVPEALDVLTRLADRSLIAVVPGDEVRYRLLDSIRAFARERLVEAGLEAVACAAHAAWFAGAADRCAAIVRGPAQPECVALVRTERADIDAALAWTAAHAPLLGVRIARGFGWTWVVLGDGVAGAGRLRAALAAAPDVDPHTAAEVLLLTGWLEASAGDVSRAAAELVRALALADADLRTDAHRHLAFLRIQQGRPQDVLVEARLALATDRPWPRAAALLLAAYGSIMLGDTATATRSATEALELLEPLGDPWGLVHARGMLGTIAQAQGRHDDAVVALEAAAADAERQGFLGQAALHLTRLGRVEQQRGRHDAAIAVLDRALGAARRSGDPRVAATARTTLARVLHVTGDDLVALALLEQNDRWYRAAGGGDGELLSRCLLAALRPEPPAALAVLRAEAQEAGDAEAELVVADALTRAGRTTGAPGVTSDAP